MRSWVECVNVIILTYRHMVFVTLELLHYYQPAEVSTSAHNLPFECFRNFDEQQLPVKSKDNSRRVN